MRSRLSYANITATLALVLALSGGAYAFTLPDDSVGTNQMRDGAVTTPKLAADAVSSAKVDDRTLRAPDAARGQLLSWRGIWSPSVSYAAREIVVNDGASFVAVDANSNDEPPSASWKMLARSGASGAGALGPEINYEVLNHVGADGTVGTKILDFHGFRLFATCEHNQATHESHLRLRAATTTEPGRIEYVEHIGFGTEDNDPPRQLTKTLFTTPVLVADLRDFPGGERITAHFVYYQGQDFVSADVTATLVERFDPYDVSCYAKGIAYKGM